MTMWLRCAILLLFVQAMPACAATDDSDTPWARLTPRDIFHDGDVYELTTASLRGDDKKVERLVRSGADVNQKGEHGLTPLFSALVAGKFKAAELLMHFGADPNVPSDDGSAPIHVASELVFDPRFLGLILSNGGNPNLKVSSDGSTALHLAIMSEDRTVEKKVSMLLASGADVNAQDNGGETPAMAAAMVYRFDIVYMLLDHGAEVSITTKSGDTLSTFVDDAPLLDVRQDQQYWHDKVSRLLRNAVMRR